MRKPTETAAPVKQPYNKHTSGLELYKKRSGEDYKRTIHTGPVANLENSADVYDVKYDKANEKQREILGAVAAAVYAKDQGCKLSLKLVNFDAPNPIERSIDAGLKAALPKVCAGKLLTLSAGGDPLLVFYPRDGVLRPVPPPSACFDHPEAIASNPFIRPLREDETIPVIMKKLQLPCDEEMLDRQPEIRKFDADPDKILQYPQLAADIRLFIIKNGLNNTPFFLDILNMLGGAPGSEACREAEELVTADTCADDLTKWIRAVSPAAVPAHLIGEYGRKICMLDGMPIFSATLPVVPTYEKDTNRYPGTAVTDYHGQKIRVIAPVNPDLFPGGSLPVSYRFTSSPDPVSCIVSVTGPDGLTYRKRYFEKDIVQLRLPVIISQFHSQATVNARRYLYLIDENMDNDILGADQSPIPDYYVEMPN